MSTTFEPGTSPLEGTIPLCVPEMRGNEVKYIQECFETNYVSSVGPHVDRFERSVADYVGTKYGVAAVNGTAALHISLLVAGIRPDDEVLMPTLTFIAPANAVRYVGAWPVFIDCEPDYWQVDPEAVVEYLERKCNMVNGELRDGITGRRVGAILVVHILGHPVEMDSIIEIAHKYRLPVIEDAAESIGAKYKGRMVGHLGSIACFSFNGNKIITTGGGGMIVTDNEQWARRAKFLTTQAKHDPVEFIHREIGYNYRLTNIQAAIGCAQMELLEEYIAVKRRIAARYNALLDNVPGIAPMAEAEWAYSTHWLFTLRIDPSEYGLDSRSLMKKLLKKGIQSRPLWQPLHLSEAHRDGVQSQPCGVAEQLNKECLSVPCSVGIRDEQLERVAGAIREIVS